MRASWRRASVICLAVAVASSCLLPAVACSAPVAFSVNGRPVSMKSYDGEVARRLAVSRKKNPKEFRGEAGERLEAETRRQVATEMIKAELMEQQARKMGVKADPREIAEKLERQQANRGFDRFEKDLAAQGLSLDDYKKGVENQVLVDELGEKVAGDVSVTTDEAESYFLTHKEQFARPAAAHVAHILLESEPEASIVADEVRRGADFADLARSLSADDATRQNGGDMGWIEQGSMEPAFEQAAFSLQPGNASGVVETGEGYEVIKVLERREAYSPEFNEVKGDVLKAAETAEKNEKFSDWLRSVYANAHVKILAGGVGKWDPRLGLVVER